MVPMTKPRMASNSVNQVSDSNSPLAIILYPTAKMPIGDPTRKAEIHPILTPISHSAKKPITAQRLQHRAAKRRVEAGATPHSARLALRQGSGAGHCEGHAVFSVWMSSSAQSAWK